MCDTRRLSESGRNPHWTYSVSVCSSGQSDFYITLLWLTHQTDVCRTLNPHNSDCLPQETQLLRNRCRNLELLPFSLLLTLFISLGLLLYNFQFVSQSPSKLNNSEPGHLRLSFRINSISKRTSPHSYVTFIGGTQTSLVTWLVDPVGLNRCDSYNPSKWFVGKDSGSFKIF